MSYSLVCEAAGDDKVLLMFPRSCHSERSEEYKSVLGVGILAYGFLLGVGCDTPRHWHSSEGLDGGGVLSYSRVCEAAGDDKVLLMFPRSLSLRT
ncbi:hypothetical protein [Fodinibius halophilus]|uniref:Uncharacterized protein n=1 Tax=Fodinibius halophilus TaxID=1736908 RepID=A0A6M1T5F5_9BACT|nr:hypothetical protein [Fodinibius halophilus]NGP87873.1 hypothetical protein [Fodinibius halophilus]